MSRTTIEREARAAAASGASIQDACSYPFGTDEADHFIAVYLLALERPSNNIPEDRQK